VQFAEQIEVFFGVKIFGGRRDVVLDRGPDPPYSEREVNWGKFCPFYNTGVADWIVILLALKTLESQGTLC